MFSGDAIDTLRQAENLEKVIVTNSIPQEMSKTKFGSMLEVVDISGKKEISHGFKSNQKNKQTDRQTH